MKSRFVWLSRIYSIFLDNKEGEEFLFYWFLMFCPLDISTNFISRNPQHYTVCDGIESLTPSIKTQPSGSPHLLPVLIPILSCIILSLHVLNLVWLMTVRRFRANMAMSRACMSFFLFGKPAIEFSMTCFQYEIILQ